jgi:hypothetical protein
VGVQLVLGQLTGVKLALGSARPRRMTTIEGEDCITYERDCVRDELTRIARLLDTMIIPHLKGHPNDE